MRRTVLSIFGKTPASAPGSADRQGCFSYFAAFPGPPTACTRGNRSSTGGNTGNAACGSV